MTYDPDRFDAEIILDRTGETKFTCEVVARILGITPDTVRQRLHRGVYERPAIEDAAIGGFIDGGNYGGGEVRKHQWSREQMIDMILLGEPKRRVPPLKPIEHGTMQGYWAEQRRKLPICDDCRLTHNAYQKKTYQEKVSA